MKSVTAMVPKIREITQMKNLDTHCRNCGNLLPLFFDKNPRKQRYFLRKRSVRVTVWKNEEFSLTGKINISVKSTL